MIKKDKQVPSYMQGDFLLYLIELMEKKKAGSQKEEGSYRTDVIYNHPRLIIDSAEVNDDGVVEIIEPSLSSVPTRKENGIYY